MPPCPGAAADQAAPAPPRSPHRGNSGAMPQSPLRIRQDGKFYERLLTKESSASAANLSFRYYWAEPGAVPFVWESQPGTPKDVARMAAGGGALPAITPPPSYLLRHGGGRQQAARHRHEQKMSGGGGGKQKRRCRLKRIRIGFIAGFFRRLSLGKAWRRAAPPVKVVASSSSRWLFSSVATEAGEHNLHHHHDEISGAAARATKPQLKTAPCRSFPTPWLPRFRSSSGSHGGGGGGGTHGGWA